MTFGTWQGKKNVQGLKPTAADQEVGDALGRVIIGAPRSSCLRSLGHGAI
jgi:hypothetical protein